jgi:hypothetical protein
MKTDTAQDDLAFMRALVTPGEDGQRVFGRAYFAAGLCYGIQMLLHGFQHLGWIAGQGPIAIAVAIGPSVVFLAILGWMLAKGPAQAPTAINRTVAALFRAVGVTNLALVLVIGSIAWRLGNPTIWLIYPCTVMILQGMAWMVVYALRRRPWLAVVAAGWFIVGIGMAIAIENLDYFILICGAGMVCFMLVPGFHMMRQARTAA